MLTSKPVAGVEFDPSEADMLDWTLSVAASVSRVERDLPPCFPLAHRVSAALRIRSSV